MSASHSRRPPGAPPRQRTLLVTGPSGAGRTTAVSALEDLGFETISNLPLSLLPRLLEGAPTGRPLALGLNIRSRGFSVGALVAELDRLRREAPGGAELLYLDCRDEVLLRRYSETRRRHPAAPAEGPAAGIAREKDLLAPVRARADRLLDTSELTPHELRDEMRRRFDREGGARLSVLVQSFSYKRGLPLSADMVLDTRFLRNPYWLPELRALDGRDAAVQAHVRGDPNYPAFMARVLDLLRSLLPLWAEEGKAHVAIAFGCTGGQHRSVTLAEEVSSALAREGWHVNTGHRELERRAAASLAPVMAGRGAAEDIAAGEAEAGEAEADEAGTGADGADKAGRGRTARS